MTDERAGAKESPVEPSAASVRGCPSCGLTCCVGGYCCYGIGCESVEEEVRQLADVLARYDDDDLTTLALGNYRRALGERDKQRDIAGDVIRQNKRLYSLLREHLTSREIDARMLGWADDEPTEAESDA